MYTVKDTSTVIHFGSIEPDRLVAELEKLAPGIVVFRDGDRWEEWGEDLRPGDTEHIVVDGLDNADALRITADVAELLTPMAYSDYQRGTIVSVTDASDHSEEVLHVTFRA